MLKNPILNIDHTVYAVAWEHKESFIKRWYQLGFRQLFHFRTSRFRADHIALTNQLAGNSFESTMIGLSSSDVPSSPINEFVRRYGEGVQHVAYNIDPEVDLVEFHEQMKQSGWNFLTPVLTYEDRYGAKLKQLFTAPTLPYGQFVEFVQRPLGPEGKTFDSFDTTNIDDFYQYYADYSQHLDQSGFLPLCGLKPDRVTYAQV